MAAPQKPVLKKPLEVTKRQYLKQSDVPSTSLEDALRVARAIAENYGAKSTLPLKVAKALNLEPGASPFRMLTGASIAYGLTDGGYNADQITLTSLAKRILKPLKEGDDITAKREAFLKPRVIREFLDHYNGSPLPREDIAVNMLEEMGVPSDRSGETFAFIVEGARGLAFVEQIKEKLYVSLDGAVTSDGTDSEQGEGEDEQETADEEDVQAPLPKPNFQNGDISSAKKSANTTPHTRRVFITHGKNRAFIDPIKKLLGFGELEAVVSVDRTSVSQPVPDKVMNEMRSCGAAIIHVEDELRIVDSTATERVVLNPNVLMEIGAAMALYGRRFILLVKQGVSLPSNLQGLFEVRYTGDMLDGDATIRLLEAINDIKNHPIPDRYVDTSKAQS